MLKLVSILAILFSFGCTKKSDTTETPTVVTKRFVYVPSIGDGQLKVYSADKTTGALTLVESKTGFNTPYAAVVSANKNFLYLIDGGTNQIITFSINSSTGALTQVTTTASGTGPVIGIRHGNFLYVGGDTEIKVFTIDNTTGALTTVETETTAENQLTHLSIHPSGTFLFSSHNAGQAVKAFTIDSTTGALTPSGTDTGSDNFAFTVFSDNGSFAYVGAAALTAHSVNTTNGTLSAASDTEALPGSNGGAIVSEDGRFLYVGNLGIIHYSLDSTTGAITNVGTESSASDPMWIAMDADETFLYMANGSDDKIYHYSVNSTTGVLTAAGSIDTGDWPMWVEIVDIPQ